MDIRLLKTYHDELHHELVSVKEDPFVKLQVPSIMRLVEMEVPRLNEIMLGMKPNEVHIDKDGLMLIKSVTDVFDVRDSASVNVLKNRLAEELHVVKHCFYPALSRIVYFVSIVIHHLEHQLVSSDDTEGQRSGSSPQQPEEVGEWKDQEVWIDYTIELKIDATPEDVQGNPLIEALRQVSIDDEDMKRLVIQKCNEAIQRCDKNLGKGDQGNTGSKDE